MRGETMYVRSFPAFTVLHPALTEYHYDDEYGQEGDDGHAPNADPQDEGRDAVTLPTFVVTI